MLAEDGDLQHYDSPNRIFLRYLARLELQPLASVSATDLKLKFLCHGGLPVFGGRFWPGCRGTCGDSSGGVAGGHAGGVRERVSDWDFRRPAAWAGF